MKIDFKDIPWTSGIKIPDRLISTALSNGQNGYDAAVKILEALNIDWKNINIPWAMLIEKWNSTNVNPFNKTSTQFENEFGEALATMDDNKVDNHVDWYRPNYDFLKDTEYYDGTQEYPYIKPGWFENGRIEKSQDIIEILNYLLWRVITLDYFTNNWNNRNSFRTTCGIIFGWNGVQQDISVPGYVVDPASVYAPYIEIDESYAADITLVPTPTRAAVIAMEQTPQFQAFMSAYPDYISNAAVMFASNAGGRISLLSNLPENIGSITVGGLDGTTFIPFTNNDNDVFYKYIIDLKLRGTAAVYNAVNGDGINSVSWLDGIKADNYSFIDPEILETSVSFKQLSTQISDGVSSTEENVVLGIKISKTPNIVTNGNVKFNGSTIRTIRSYWNSDTALTCIERGTQEITIPYLLNLPNYDNKYVISITPTYGENYGIHPYFFIKVSDVPIGVNSFNADGTFARFDSDWGNIEYENGEYYYVPCEEPASHNNQVITICCVLYYSDTENSRQCTPTVVSFDVKLTAEVKNKVLFLAPGEEYEVWDSVSQRFISRSAEGSNCISTNPNEKGVIASSNITYATRTLTYGENIDNDIETIIFDNFVTTYCGIKPDIELVGVIDQSIDTRTIELYNVEQDGKYGKITNSVGEYNIYKELYTKIGEEEDGSFYYSADSAINYNVPQSVFESMENDDDISSDNFTVETTDLTEIIESTNSVNFSDYDNVYTLMGSTAKFPNTNGIYEDNGTYVNADSDYYYLVFRISCDRGSIGSISYSACKGYYFLRVLRNEEQPTLALRSITEDPIIYEMGGETYSIRAQVRQTIYLNRLFSDESQKILEKYKGKKFWCFYNVNGQINSAAKWDDKIVAITNELNSEVYMKIFNEGDSYPSTEYKFNKYNYNTNTVIDPEADVVAIDWVSSDETEVKQFNITDGNILGGESDLSSGAILYINKLMKALYSGDTIVGYTAVTSDSVILPLSLSIGNSSKYTRLNSTTTFMINIFKQRYDIDIMVIADSENTDHDYRVFNYYTLGNPFNITINHDYTDSGFEITPSSSLSEFGDIPKVFFASNEFIGSDDDFDTSGSVNANDEDSIPIIVSSDTSKFSIKNAEGYNIYPNISITSQNTNKDEWIVASTFNKFNDYTDKNVVVVYVTGMNNKNINKDYRRALYLFPMNASQSVDNIEFTIAGDDNGIYANKTLNLYVHPNVGMGTIQVF